MLRSVPASVAFEPRSKNKKKGDKEGDFRGDLRGKENYPPRTWCILKRKVRKGLVKVKRGSRGYILFRYGVDQNVTSLTCGSWSRLTGVD